MRPVLPSYTDHQLCQFVPDERRHIRVTRHKQLIDSATYLTATFGLSATAITTNIVLSHKTHISTTCIPSITNMRYCPHDTAPICTPSITNTRYCPHDTAPICTPSITNMRYCPHDTAPIYKFKAALCLLLCEYPKFRIKSNSYFSIRFETSTTIPNFRILTVTDFFTYL